MAQAARADVVVIVDTSTSMRDPGMDPERASLLVAKLFADIVPGDLAVVRLLDIGADADVIPSRRTDEAMPCSEDPSRTCFRVVPEGDWGVSARTRKLGALIRPDRADGGYKNSLEEHLVQRVNNSMFDLAFRAAQGVFAEHETDSTRPRDVPRTVIWLSDGRSDNPDGVRHIIGELKRDGVALEPFVFGRGETTLAEAANLLPRRVSTPSEMMKAFAGAFRRIVQAPYEIDNTIAAQPSFEMKRAVDEAWIVVYGDDTLGDVMIEGPGQSMSADYAVDSWRGAGAYKVAYIERPSAGMWTVRAKGGGTGVAYAVVQRSSLSPVLLEPRRALSGANVRLIAGVRAGQQTEILRDPELLRDLTITAEFQGQTVTLLDRGVAPDAAANDGHFSGTARFRGSGKVPVRIRIRSPLVDRFVDSTVDVSGLFRYTGGPVEIDLGTMSAAQEVCRPLLFNAQFQGEVPFSLQSLRGTPSGHDLTVRLPSGRLKSGNSDRIAKRGDRFEVCLATSKRAPSSSAHGEPWLELTVAGSDMREQKIPIRLRWEVHGLSFWQRWGALILAILVALAILFIIGGYVLPQRFQNALAVVFVPDRDELEEQVPQPVKQWRGVGIGFYRNARAFLHADFRLSGNARGALAALHAEKGGARVMAGRGLSLSRETLGADWEIVPADGRKARGGDVYRIGDRGPYFRIATRGTT
ncbi:MAG TPA: choice-of-anchor X domain-containing protein [Thermoanaerobaculia bacterium]|nr:choice-of-anchor X domain-containing protein [Thermoanaerobaculia bacterium]